MPNLTASDWQNAPTDYIAGSPAAEARHSSLHSVRVHSATLRNIAAVKSSLMLLFCLTFWACSSADPKPTSARAAAPQTIPVGVSTAERRDVPVYLNGLGSILAFNTVSIKSRVDGQLLQVNFKEGQNVKKGQLLALVDPRPYEVQLSQAQAQLFKDEASFRDAKLNYQRFKDLLQQSGAMSQQQVDTQLATANQLEGAVRADQAQVDNAKLNLVYCHITAPISGRIGIRLVDVGNMVHASDANPMLVITQLQPITALFTLPEDNLPAVSRHMAQGSLPVEAYSRDDQTKLATGKLLTIDNTIDQSTGTGRLKAVFENADSQLWPNQFVNIRLLLEVKKNAIVVPAAAIQRGPQGSFVYAVKPDKTVEVRPVNVALTQNNVSVVASGLNPGDMVVTDGQDKLQSGTKVEPRSGGTGGSRPAQSSATGTP
jgi:membrane fusion protein, multidrug efflux system